VGSHFARIIAPCQALNEEVGELMSVLALADLGIRQCPQDEIGYPHRESCTPILTLASTLSSSIKTPQVDRKWSCSIVQISARTSLWPQSVFLTRLWTSMLLTLGSL
jgi:hypothetical protein